VLGVPAKIRGPIDNTAWIEHGVGEYVAAAEHYRRHLSTCLSRSASPRTSEPNAATGAPSAGPPDHRYSTNY